MRGKQFIVAGALFLMLGTLPACGGDDPISEALTAAKVEKTEGGGGQGEGKGQSQNKGKGAGKGKQALTADDGICEISTSVMVCDLSGDQSPSEFCAEAEFAANLVAGGRYHLGGC